MGVVDKTITYITGEPIRGATVRVLLANTTTEAEILDPIDEATPIAQPMVSSLTGRVHFAAAGGTYDLEVTTAKERRLIEDVVVASSGLGPGVGLFGAFIGNKAKNPEIIEASEFGAIFVGHVDSDL